MGQEVPTFPLGEHAHQRTDPIPKSIDGSLRGLAEQRLEFGEGHLDWIEVRGIRRQVQQTCTDAFYRRPNADDLVDREVVHDDAIAGFQGRQKKVPDISQEDGAIHRPISDHRCGDPITSQRRDECRDVPMAVRHFSDQPLAFRSPAAQPGHIRADTGFIDEHQVSRIERCLALTPGVAGGLDVRTILLGGVLCFF